MDLFDRQIIGHTVGISPNLDLTNRSLRQAITTLVPGQHPVVHSDQGFQYQHLTWRRLLDTAGCTSRCHAKATVSITQ